MRQLSARREGAAPGSGRGEAGEITLRERLKHPGYERFCAFLPRCGGAEVRN